MRSGKICLGLLGMLVGCVVVLGMTGGLTACPNPCGKTEVDWEKNYGGLDEGTAGVQKHITYVHNTRYTGGTSLELWNNENVLLEINAYNELDAKLGGEGHPDWDTWYFEYVALCTDRAYHWADAVAVYNNAMSTLDIADYDYDVSSWCAAWDGYRSAQNQMSPTGLAPVTYALHIGTQQLKYGTTNDYAQIQDFRNRVAQLP